MRVPVQVMVGGKAVKIEYPDTLPEGNSGEVVCQDQVVKIAKDRHKDEKAVLATLFHELTHFALHVTGHSATWSDEKEEPLVYALENMLAPLFVICPSAPVKWKDLEWPEED